MAGFMRSMLVCSWIIFLAGVSLQAADPYSPLTLYQGTWRELPDGKKPFQLTNVCGRIGEYFGCQQTIDGRIGSLIIFVPAKEAGHYYTQSVLPEGWATGRGELEIRADRWTFQSKEADGAKTVYYRTTNTFSGKDRIHYEMFQSTDGQHWTATGSGDELRASHP